MTHLDQSDSQARFAFVIAKEDVELAIEIARPNEIVVTVGVPARWISEEPSQSIRLTHAEARRIGDAFRAAAEIGP